MGTPFYDYVVNELGTPYHWWRMDSALNAVIPDVGDAGANLEQLSKPNADGTWTHGGTGLIADDSSKCIEFTANTGTGATFSSTGGTIYFANEDIGSVVFFVKGTPSASTNWIFGGHPDNAQFIFYTNASGTLIFNIIAGTSSRTWTGPSGVNDNATHMIAMTCDGVNPNKMYIDGVFYTDSSASGGAGAVQTHDWVNTVRDAALTNLGITAFGSVRYATPAFNTPWLGKMDETMLFSETLSATQIDELWRRSQALSSVTPRTVRRRKSVMA